MRLAPSPLWPPHEHCGVLSGAPTLPLLHDEPAQAPQTLLESFLVCFFSFFLSGIPAECSVQMRSDGVLSRGDNFHKFILKSSFCQYLWQWFFEQPNHSFLTLKCKNLFYLKACFAPFTPFYFSLSCFLIKALNGKSPAFMYNSQSFTGSIFSHHSFPSVDVSSMHYCQSIKRVLPI